MVVGGGVAGSALAVALARAGISVLVLERTVVHVDRVRGEWLAPWGVAEAKALRLYDALIAAGAHHTRRHVPFGEGIEPDVARTRAIDLTSVVPGVPGALCMPHATLCNVLNELATAAGAMLLRGVHGIEVAPGPSPEVRFHHDGAEQRVRCKLIVGADGRSSSVARQAGITVEKDSPHHLLAGLLVEGAEDWPEDTQTIGIEGDVAFYVFPQGEGRARLYLCYAREQRSRFAGANGAVRFLDAFRLASVPGSASLAGAVPAGPCHGYPNEDSWADMPVAPGVVLIGDAAGHNDPTIGQGLAIALRDARIVADLVTQSLDRQIDQFGAYIEERRERMRRLRFVGRLVSAFRAEFGEEARMRRRRMAENIAANPSAALPLSAPLRGPDTLPAEAFEPAAWERLVGYGGRGEDDCLKTTR